MYIKWISTEEVDRIYLPNTNQMKDIESEDKIYFHFGTCTRELSVRKSDNLPRQTIGLSENIKNEVFIPEDLFYDINITENSISLGPVILYLISKRFLTRLDKVKDRLEKFVPVNGLIMISEPSGINTEQQLIKGYYFRPSNHEREATLKEGVFQYPGAIFKRVPLSLSLNEHLKKRTNGFIFNSKFFNKWDMWKWLSPDQSVRGHLPDTKELSTLEEIEEMVSDFQTIYLKPKSGSRGKGIIQIRHEGDSYHIIDDKNKKWVVECLEQQPVIDRVLKKKGEYMIQQGVPLVHESRNVDFRIYMQKDQTKDWKCTGLIARVAKPGSITTNLSHVDYLIKGKEAFNRIYGLDEREGELLFKQIEATCKKACQLLDQQGHFADIAIDFILDKELHVWILEMNKRYGYKSFSIIEDTHLFGDIISNPFFYASALTGFINARRSE
ncbi:YheC/YheD family protein [Alkalihalophilus sp. As8PL]|uniref:YheC/YheD family protein n=1 Tax=Alkalihalophilus sp. As8PL TaxID=3237103 RepID=A0AB39BVB2_9BACI